MYELSRQLPHFQIYSISWVIEHNKWSRSFYAQWGTTSKNPQHIILVSEFHDCMLISPLFSLFLSLSLSPAPVFSLSPLLPPSPIPPPSFSHPLSLSSPSPSSPPPLSLQMLTSVLGMLETTRQAVTMLKERVMTTQAELERKEVCLLSSPPLFPLSLPPLSSPLLHLPSSLLTTVAEIFRSSFPLSLPPSLHPSLPPFILPSFPSSFPPSLPSSLTPSLSPFPA